MNHDTSSAHIWPQYGGLSADLQPTAEALAAAPKRACEDAQLLPIRLEGAKLVCAGYPPYNSQNFHRFRYIIRRELTVIEATKEEVQLGLLHAYGINPHPEAKELLQSVTVAVKKGHQAKELGAKGTMNWGSRRMKSIAITGGKGGVGKSTIAANLGISLARLGLRVGMVDCDFGLSNLHVLLGVNPEVTIGDVVAKKVDALSAFTPGPYQLRLLAGCSGSSEMIHMDYRKMQAIGAGLENLEPYFDIVILDTAAGLSEGVLSILAAADETITVVTPEPSSVLDAYATLKLLVERKPNAKISCLMNEAVDHGTARMTSAKLQSYLQTYADTKVEYLGSVRSDKYVRESGRTRLPFVLSDPTCPAARDMAEITRTVARLDEPAVRKTGENLVSRLFSRLSPAS